MFFKVDSSAFYTKLDEFCDVVRVTCTNIICIDTFFLELNFFENLWSNFPKNSVIVGSSDGQFTKQTEIDLIYCQK